MMMTSVEAATIGVLLDVILLLSSSNGYPMYQQQIPNGDHIPNPCNRSTIWPGVGHQNVYGSGPRNPFGLDFAANGHVWNRTLCMKDSDGDGRKNGEELGDPNCIWTPNNTASITNSANLTHPGVCEPLDSHNCVMVNSWLDGCGPKTFDCPAINDPAVTNFTLRFPVTPIPKVETTYICHAFVLPANTTSDIIAIEPVVANAEILHHMLLFGCTGKPESDQPVGETFECGMAANPPCLGLIGAWGVGIEGVCLNSQMGYRIGPNGFQYAILQLHWNNPLLKQNLTDSSGMKIYRTTNLRPNRGQILIVGQKYLDIPPNQQEVTYTGNCTSGCTNELPHSIFITSTILHMHTAGQSGEIALYRNGERVYTFEVVTAYDYNNPLLNSLANVVEVKPGDKIYVKCVFSSIGRNYTTVWGEATSNEMCYAFLAYYPLVEELQYCTQWKTVNECWASSGVAKVKSEYCDVPSFLKILPLATYACNASCTETTACQAIVNGINATECPNNPDVMQYTGKDNSWSSDLDLYKRCASVVPPPTKCHENYLNRSPGISMPFATVVMLSLFCISLANST